MGSHVAFMHAPHFNTKMLCGADAKIPRLIDAVGIEIDMGMVALDCIWIFHGTNIRAIYCGFN